MPLCTTTCDSNIALKLLQVLHVVFLCQKVNKSNMSNSTIVHETTKTVQIRDAFKNLRYEVQLKSTQLSLDAENSTAYQIQVVNFHYAPDPLVVLTKQTTVYGQALRCFDECVSNYTSLVKAETRDFQDMSLYTGKNGYKITCPQCCATCQWCRRRPLGKEFTFGATFKLECWSPKNSTLYSFDIDECQCRKHFGMPHEHHLDIHPNVRPFGICDNYELRTTPYVPVQGDKLTQFIDRRIDWKLSAELSDGITPIVSAILSDQLSSTILPEVGKAIEQQLSTNMPIIEGNRLINDYNNDGVVDGADEIVIGCDLGA